MSKIFRFFAMGLVLCTGSLFAHIHPGQGGWGLDAEWLYLFPTVDDTYFVLDADASATNPTGTRRNNDFGFQSGFRVGGYYGACECDREFQIYYTRLYASENRTVTGSFLWATLGRPDLTSSFENYSGSATSDLSLMYHRLDGIVAQRGWCFCGTTLYFQGGLEFAYLRLHENYQYRSTSLGEISQKSQAWGVGPQGGVEFDYNICQFSCCCPGTLSLAVFSTGSLLVSKTQSEVHNTLAGVTVANVGDEHTWRIIPAWHTRIGFNYQTCFSCFAAALEIGYEFNTYVRGLSRIEFPDDVADGECFTNYYNFDVQGLYVSLAVAF